MLFNSYLFLLAFLPVVLAGFFFLGRVAGRPSALFWLVAASLTFYASWELAYLWLLLASLLFNYFAAALLRRLTTWRLLWLWLGILTNVALLLYFKVAIAFFGGSGASFSTTHQILIPLGISFITFQQIAFLVDSYKGRLKQGSVVEYLLFITFFPQLIMGPIVQYRELQPQFRSESLLRWNAENFSLGLCIFIVGLFKKVVLADSIAPFVDGVYADVGNGASISPIDAWAAALGFTLQLYFDFSAYSDMAIGLARMFNINLPINFDSPYRAVDRFDYWRRWHISFSSFMRQYVFFPLARARNLHVGQVGALAVTTLLSGFWHGLGATFIVWGSLQTLLMLGVHYRGVLVRKFGPAVRGRGFPRISMLLTFVITVVLGVLFRSSDLQMAFGVYENMLLAVKVVLGGDIAGLYLHVHRTFDRWVLLNLLLLLLIVWGMPNTRDLFARYWTALDQRSAKPGKAGHDLQFWLGGPVFVLNRRWAIVMAVMLSSALVLMSGTSRFIYYQF